MLDELAEEYPEATPRIREAIREHSKEWVLDNYYQQFRSLGLVMDVPEKSELPFYDPEEHTTMTDEQKREMAAAYSQYRENLRTAGQNATEQSDR